MRSENEMISKILEFAQNDDRIRAVLLNGSRANSSCVCDKLSDFDVQYIVVDIKSFLTDKKWIHTFGELLIMQEPENWYNHPYDMSNREPYAFLMQFADGNRIDLTLIDQRNMESFYKEKEPRKVLLNKDDNLVVPEIESNKSFYVQKPTEKEFTDIVNEFLWLSLYVAKGIWRSELCYAKTFMDHYEVEMLCKMVSWKIGVDNDFNVSTGKAYKYFKRYLTAEEMEGLSLIYSKGEYDDIEEKLLYSLKYFQKISSYVGRKLLYPVDIDQMVRVRKYIEDMHLTTAST